MGDVVPWQSRVLDVFLRSAIRFQARAGEPWQAFISNLAGNDLSREEEETLRRVLRMRQNFGNDHRKISAHDYGTGGGGEGKAVPLREVSSIYRTSPIPHWWGIFLFRFVRRSKPTTVLELGTNLGVSAAYLQSALDLNKEGHLTTVEGDPALAEIASEAIAEACTGAPTILVGRFAEVLPQALPSLEEVDLAFIDGHHEFEATKRYYSMIKPCLSDGGAVIFDDIYLWSRAVRKAWNEIVRTNEGACLDLAKIGILFPRRGISS